MWVRGTWQVYVKGIEAVGADNVINMCFDSAAVCKKAAKLVIEKCVGCHHGLQLRGKVAHSVRHNHIILTHAQAAPHHLDAVHGTLL